MLAGRGKGSPKASTGPQGMLQIRVMKWSREEVWGPGPSAAAEPRPWLDFLFLPFPPSISSFLLVPLLQWFVQSSPQCGAL